MSHDRTAANPNRGLTEPANPTRGLTEPANPTRGLTEPANLNVRDGTLHTVGHPRKTPDTRTERCGSSWIRRRCR